jgi:hypothetical protein
VGRRHYEPHCNWKLLVEDGLDGATHIYPNLLVHRDGPALESRVIWPVARDQCEVWVDLWCDALASLGLDETRRADAHRAQVEAIARCEKVQRALRLGGVVRGEHAAPAQFHLRLAADLD